MLADANGNVVKKFELDCGYGLDILLGHAMVVHDGANGNARAGCATIKDSSNNVPNTLSADMSVYPGYMGALNVTGQVNVWASGSGLVVNFRLGGLPANMMGGLHVHSGTSCANSSGHYWTPAPSPDPWLTTMWTSAATGNPIVAEGAFNVNSGYTLAQNEGHAVVIHDPNNSTIRVACGILAFPPPATTCPDTTSLFQSCRAYDFSLYCTAMCATAVQNFVARAANLTLTANDVSSCLIAANRTVPWSNGDIPAFEQRYRNDTSKICVMAPNSATTFAPFLSVLVLLFLAA
jgi:Cu/Zn superoxide dismutase